MAVPIPEPVTAADVTTAAFGLGGVLVGALVTAGMDYWLQKRREAAEREAERRRVRASSRLVLSVLEEVGAALQNVSQQGWWYAQDGERWATVWDHERTTLAANLADDEFEQVANGFLAARMFHSQAAAANGGLNDDDREKFDVWIGAVSAGSGALR
jgi:hypothetical protein